MLNRSDVSSVGRVGRRYATRVAEVIFMSIPLYDLAPDMKISHLEQLIRRDIEREMQDILDLENHINSNLDFIKTKKRQLEIKKRQPLQCFLNIVSCWKRK
ncbi:hypothetical protein LSH36_81g00011 [Paralvinella palmiformis]|uniref:Uncharacterized protein n=1 Tax=Paralvinella palmiformis TaxID=53620 RepID=A0AAD9K1W3_9ANNE|nr:hypothetical protein LSH36_81g00011 [Paralvinella palmiformis]